MRQKIAARQIMHKQGYPTGKAVSTVRPRQAKSSPSLLTGGPLSIPLFCKNTLPTMPLLSQSSWVSVAPSTARYS
jgi:hypothetical protein